MTLEERFYHLKNSGLIIASFLIITCHQCTKIITKYIVLDTEYTHPSRELCIECYEGLGK